MARLSANLLRPNPRPDRITGSMSRKNQLVVRSHIIDVDGVFVGAAIRIDRGYRFVATDFRPEELDSSLWPTLEDVRRVASRALLAPMSAGATVSPPLHAPTHVGTCPISQEAGTLEAQQRLPAAPSCVAPALPPLYHSPLRSTVAAGACLIPKRIVSLGSPN
jgi:hypothetical protein